MAGWVPMLSRFLKNCRGGVAPMLALSAIPLMGSVGAAVDFSRVNAARTALQASLDSTALMLSKTAATQTGADLQTTASNIFNALFTRPEAKNVAISASYSSTNGSTVTLNGSATIGTNFLGVFGVNQIDIAATTKSTWGNTRLRVALVLDNTGSMADSGKIGALKTASQSLLTQLKSAAVNVGDVYVSIIPFVKDVNVGASNYNQSWLRWDLWEAVNGTCSNSSYTTQSTCVSHSKKWTPANHSTWNGCITDRDQNFDTTNDAPVAGATLYPAEQYGSCPSSLMGLSYDWTALSNKINAMQANGNTNQAIGLQMGWQSLTAAPFTVPAMDPNYKYKQVIILLTDGLNTEDRWYTNQSSIDTRQQKTCDNVKAAGITIYTVQVNTGGDPTSTLLQNCASDASKFFLLTSSTQIVGTFNQIGTAISNLRIAM
jgi:Flp pilus assembly protein TadG